MAPQPKPDTKRIWGETAPPNNLEDPDITQANRFTTGWIAEKPPFENFNYVWNLFTKADAYINEQGVGYWDVATTYPIGGQTKGSDDHSYIAIVQQAGNDPVSDGGTNWIRYLATKAELDVVDNIVGQNQGNIAVNQLAINANTLKNDEQELEIDNNLNLIGVNTSNLAITDGVAGANQSAIVALNNDLASTDIIVGTNQSGVSSNLASIGVNATAISVNAGAIAANTVAINNIPSATQATEIAAGIAEIATQVEVDAGVVNDPYVSPLKLKTFIDSLSSSVFGADGSITLKMSDEANPITIQWGTVSVAGDTDAWTSVNLPTAFTNNVYFVTGQQSGSGLTTPGDSFAIRLKAASLTQFDFYSNGAIGSLEITFIAIGD